MVEITASSNVPAKHSQLVYIINFEQMSEYSETDYQTLQFIVEKRTIGYKNLK